MNVEKLFPIFFAIWAVLGIGTTLFYAKAGVEAKRRWHPWLMIGAGALFCGLRLRHANGSEDGAICRSSRRADHNPELEGYEVLSSVRSNVVRPIETEPVLPELRRCPRRERVDTR